MTTATRITDDQLKYHREVIQNMKTAAQRLREAQAEAIAAEAAVVAWSKHLTQEYDLPENASVDEDGNINTTDEDGNASRRPEGRGVKPWWRRRQRHARR